MCTKHRDDETVVSIHDKMKKIKLFKEPQKSLEEKLIKNKKIMLQMLNHLVTWN